MPLFLDAPEVVGFTLVAAVLGLYGVIVLARRRRFRGLSSKLRAHYVSTGLFAPGKVVGPDFSIDAGTVGLGRYKRYHTTVTVAAPGAPGSYLVKVGFFNGAQDWKHALVLGTKTDRVFVKAISLSYPRYVETNAEQRRALLEWLNRSGVPDVERLRDTLQKHRIRELWVAPDSITVYFRGAVSNFDRLSGTVNTLRRLANPSRV